MYSVHDLDFVVDHTLDAFEHFKGQRVLLTGGTGFFGSWLTQSWTRATQRMSGLGDLWVLCRKPQAPQPAINWITGDIRDFKWQGSCDLIIHAATSASAALDCEQPEEMKSVIIGGANRIAELSSCLGSKVIFTSSGAVYGSQSDSIGEESVFNFTGADSAYTQAKREAEKILSEAVIARCFAFVGPGLPLDAHFAIGNFIRDALDKKIIQVQGDGTPIRSYLYAADLVIWLLTLANRAKMKSIYNIGSDQEVSIAELAGQIAQLGGVSYEIQKKSIDVNGRNTYLPQIQKAKKEFGLKVFTPLRDAIKKTMEYHL